MGGAANRFRQALAELFLQEANYLAHALQGEALAAKFTDDGYLREVFERINSPMSLARRDHDAALVPPLQLAGGDAGEANHLAGWECILHITP